MFAKPNKSKGAFTRAADGIAKHGKTKAKRFDEGGIVDPNATAGPAAGRLYQSLPAATTATTAATGATGAAGTNVRADKAAREAADAARRQQRQQRRESPAGVQRQATNRANTAAIRQLYANNPTAMRYNPNGPDQRAINYWNRQVNRSGLGAVQNGLFNKEVDAYAAANPMDNTSAIQQMYANNPTAMRYNPNGPDANALAYWNNKINTDGLSSVQGGGFGSAVDAYAAANPMKKGGAVKKYAVGGSVSSKPMKPKMAASNMAPSVKPSKPKAYAKGGCAVSTPAMKSGGGVKKARGGGCEVKGKTKGRYI